MTEQVAQTLLAKHAEAIELLGHALSMNFETPANTSINRFLRATGLSRVEYEQLMAHRHGVPYAPPPPHLLERWARF